MKMRVAVTDDWQDVSRSCASWDALQARADVVWFTAPFADDDAAVAALADFDVIIPMRDRTKLPAAFLKRLPRLKMIAQTGMLALHIDVPYCDAHGIPVCGSVAEKLNVNATPELTLGLILAAAHHIVKGDANMRAGRFQEGIAFGETLAGGTMGVIGLGNIGKRMVQYGRMLGMDVLAWSPNMTAERATAAGATFVSKDELMSRSDVVTLHLVHADSTVGIIGVTDLARMKRGAMFVNTARGALVDEVALIAALTENRIIAALDVYEREPLPADHPLRTLPNTVLTPHLGFIKRDAFTGFYTQSVENVLAWLDGAPMRLLNLAQLDRKAS
jgi:phosphoglycerate dehydrogenase-like enzyme